MLAFALKKRASRGSAYGISAHGSIIVAYNIGAEKKMEYQLQNNGMASRAINGLASAREKQNGVKKRQAASRSRGISWRA